MPDKWIPPSERSKQDVKKWVPPAPSATKQDSPEAPAPVFGGTAPQAEPKAAFVLEGPKPHTVKVIKQVDPTQKFPFFASCTCQFQSRAKTELEIRTNVQRHFERQDA